MNNAERELCLTRIVTDWQAIRGAQDAFRVVEEACRRLRGVPFDQLTPEEKRELEKELTPQERCELVRFRAVKKRLLQRYWPAVQHYLEGRLRKDPAGADQVCSDFTLRFLEKEAVLAQADPTKGHFRPYLKTILYRMVADYWRGKQRQARHVGPIGPVDPADPRPGPDDGPMTPEELERWHREVVRAAWRVLEEAEAKGGPPYARVMLLKDQDPEPSSAEIARQLTAEKGAPVTNVRVRQWVHRGRELFTDALVAETARSLQDRSPELVGPGDVRAALLSLNLFHLTQDALKRHESRGG